MKFSVVLVNYASWTLTLRCVEALCETPRRDFEVIVVDNDPGEPPELPPWIRLIRNPTNAGFARGCNQGVAAAAGELVVLINPDAVVERDFFDLVESFFSDNPAAGIAGPRVLDGDGGIQLSARKEIGPLSGILGRTSLLTRLFPGSPVIKRYFPALTEMKEPAIVDWVSGACLVSRSRVLEEVRGLDERFFMYFEDADLCRRARGDGWLVYYLPHVTVSHSAGGSTGSMPRAIWHLHKSAFLYHRKHGRHGPVNFYSLAVLTGLFLRASARLAASFASRLLEEGRIEKRGSGAR